MAVGYICLLLQSVAPNRGAQRDIYYFHLHVHVRMFCTSQTYAETMHRHLDCGAEHVCRSNILLLKMSSNTGGPGSVGRPMKSFSTAGENKNSLSFTQDFQ